MDNNKPKITAKDYLEGIGVDLTKTTFITVLDGHLRQVDILYIMECYAEEKVRESKNFNSFSSN
jgi:hypothetical protein